MNRWFGSKDDSDQQASSRNARAARRTISRQPVPVAESESEDEFGDCNTSNFFLNVDGGDDLDNDTSSTTSSMVDAAAAAAAELTRQRGLPVEDADFENDVDAWKKDLKLKFDAHDVEYWFNMVESQMKKYGINRQWDKKDAVVPLLPECVVDEIKPFLRLSQADAGDQIYKQIKTEILTL